MWFDRLQFRSLSIRFPKGVDILSDSEYLSQVGATPFMGRRVVSSTDNEGGAHTLLLVLDITWHPMNGGSSLTYILTLQRISTLPKGHANKEQRQKYNKIKNKE